MAPPSMHRRARRSVAFLAATAAAIAVALVEPVAAFTNGTILPSYLCGPANDGLPKSLGGVLALLQEDGSALTVAGYHGDAQQITASYGLATATSTSASITPGQTFAVSIKSTTSGAHLLGLLAWVEDQYGKLGYWSAFGTGMAAHPGCMATGLGGNQVPVVAVHTTALDNIDTVDPTTYTGLVWQAPAIMYSTTVLFKGLAIIDGAFGYWNTTFTVTGATTTTAPFAASGSQPQRVFKCVSAGTAVTSTVATAATTSANAGTHFRRDYLVGGLPPRKN
ncbi:hypothetical protein HK405_014699 [Cladochytrium tenue]|nr:hypothetical protein HK405_014699 [Cladochytrium tenue]